MTQVTVRRVEEAWVAKAKAEAAERGVSMNTVLVEAIEEKFGGADQPKTNGLEKFAGCMPYESSEERSYWKKFLNEDLNEIHPDDWK